MINGLSLTNATNLVPRSSTLSQNVLTYVISAKYYSLVVIHVFCLYCVVSMFAVFTMFFQIVAVDCFAHTDILFILIFYLFVYGQWIFLFVILGIVECHDRVVKSIVFKFLCYMKVTGVWVRILVVTLVSLSKILNYHCFSSPRVRIILS